MQRICVVDTNVVVSGLIVADSSSPPARILNAMIDGSLMYLMSPELLDEYAAVLGRPALVRIHGRTRDELDRLLTESWSPTPYGASPAPPPSAPDPGDNHLWALLARSEPRAQLVTGDRRFLLANPPSGVSVVTPRDLSDVFLR